MTANSSTKKPTYYTTKSAIEASGRFIGDDLWIATCCLGAAMLVTVILKTELPTFRYLGFGFCVVVLVARLVRWFRGSKDAKRLLDDRLGFSRKLLRRGDTLEDRWAVLDRERAQCVNAHDNNVYLLGVQQALREQAELHDAQEDYCCRAQAIEEGPGSGF